MFFFACSVLLVFLLVFVCVLLLYFSCHVRNLPKQIRKAIGAIGMYQIRELLYQGRSVHRYLDLYNKGYSLYLLVFWMLHYEHCSFFDCITFEMW